MKVYGPQHRALSSSHIICGFKHLDLGQNHKAVAEFRLAGQLLHNSAGRLLSNFDNSDVQSRRVYRMQGTAFRGLMAAISKIIQDRGGQTDTYVQETFLGVQSLLKTSTSSALEQVAARFAAGSDSLSKLVRKNQDLHKQRKALDKQVLELRTADTSSVDKTTLNSMKKRIKDLGEQIQKSDLNLFLKFPQYSELSNPQPLTIEETQKLLRKGEGLVQFMFARNEGFAWLVTQQKSRWVKLNVKSIDINDMVYTLRAGLDRSSGDVIDTTIPGGMDDPSTHRSQGLKFDLSIAHKLYKKLFGQLEIDLKGIEHLIIIPQGA